MHEDHPGLVVGARRNSPLVIGLGEGENFLGSDVAAFVEHTRNALAIGQDQIVAITPDGVTRHRLRRATPSRSSRSRCCGMPRPPTRAAGRRFMAKEICEEPEAVANTIRGRVRDGQVVIPELDGLDELFAGIQRIIIIACGTAAYAGLVGKYAIEQWTRVPVDVELAHEFRYRDPVIGADTLVVSISQSGETMDTLMAVKYARERGARTLSICNTQGATIPRESDAIVYTHAGPEVAVASTKAFVAQITALYLLGAARRPRPRHRSARPRPRSTCSSSRRSPTRSARSSSAEQARIEQFAHWMADTRSVLFLGRHVGYPIALEGALKLKELAYIHAEGFAAGELKHGPIALIEPGQPVFVIVPSPRESARAAQEGRLEHRGDPRPRRPRHRDRRRGRRRRAAATPTRCCASRSPGRSSSRCSPSCRCTSSRWASRPPRASTSTSPATSRSPSRSSSPRASGSRGETTPSGRNHPHWCAREAWTRRDEVVSPTEHGGMPRDKVAEC